VDDVLMVIDVVEGGGAAEVGLQRGDALITIDGEKTSVLGFLGGVEKIRGAENSSVHLVVRRGGAAVEVDVPRRRIMPK
jgi:C-terminal processing protease CtpA/Prc